MLDQFTGQIEAFPKLNSNLEAISKIPAALTSLASKIEKNNAIAIEKINKKVERIEFLATTQPNGAAKAFRFPLWVKVLLVACALMFFLSSLFMGYCSYKIMKDTSAIKDVNNSEELMMDSTSVADTLSAVQKTVVDTSAIRSVNSMIQKKEESR